MSETLNLRTLMDLADQFKTPHPAMVKMCSRVSDYLWTRFGTTPSDIAGIQTTLNNCPVFINEEIPPDRIVFYDQHDNVYHVLKVTLPTVTP